MKSILSLFLLALPLAAADPATNSAARGTNASSRSDLLISADSFEFTSTNKLAVYTGNVRVVDPPVSTNARPTTLTCKILTVKLPSSGTKIESILAEGDVVIDQGDSHATGARAVYRASTDVLELTGNPMLILSNAVLKADMVMLDRGTGRMRASGHVVMTVKSDAIGTNTTRLPDLKPTNAAPVKDQP